MKNAFPWPFLSLLGCAVAGYLAWRFGADSPFVKESPTEYGRVMFSVLIAGLAGTFLGYIITGVELTLAPKDSDAKAGATALAMCLLFLATALVGVIAWRTIQHGAPFRDRFDWEDICTLAFAVISTVAVAIVSAISKDSYRWRLQLWAVELPLLFALSCAIIGKQVVYVQANEAFNGRVTTNMFYPTGMPFRFEQSAQQLRQEFRASFWSGATVGITGISLLMAQLASLGVEVATRRKK